MIRNIRTAVIVGMAGVAMSACALAQSGTTIEQKDAPAQAGPISTAALPPDQQATKEQISKLLEVMRVKQQMDSMMKMMPAMIEQQMKTQMEAIKAKMPDGKQIPPDEQAAIDKMMIREVDRATHIVSYDDIISDLTEVYQRHISRTDADALIAFYNSAAARHLQDAQPVIMKEYMPKVMAHVNEKTQELTDAMMKDIAELTKQYEQPAKPAPSKQ